jgi:glycine betaine/proline transport system substrate-binding protein
MTLKTRVVSTMVAGLVAMGFAGSASSGGMLKVPVPDWTGGAVTCEVYHYILENEMGYKVKRITMPSGPGVAEGERAGDIDFHCESWPSYSTTNDIYMTEWGGDGSIIKLGDVGVIGTSSYYIPSYLLQANGGPIANNPKIADMNDHVDLFKGMDTGDKGRLLGCPTPAWECSDQERLDLLGINFKAIELGSGTAHWAELKAACERKEPFIAYAWTPHWIFAVCDMVSVELPAFDDNKTWPATGWDVDITYNAGRPGMETEHPKVVQLLRTANLTNNQQAGMIKAIDIDGRDIEEVVAEWMEANRDIWSSWVPD